jgi:hypothetical protein
MPNTYRTARGEVVDLDMLKLANESVIAIGNMKTNARGDQLGSGGKVVKTRAQIMQEYHQLHSPMADNTLPGTMDNAEMSQFDDQSLDTNLVTPTAQDILPASDSGSGANTYETPTGYTKPRGSFADAVAKQTEVRQEITNPVLEKRAAQKKVQRI